MATIGAPQAGLASVHVLRTEKLGSLEEFELLLARRLRDRGDGHLLILRARPPEWLGRLFADAGAEVQVIDFDAEGLGGVNRLLRLCRARGVRTLLFSFFGLHQPAWLYAMLRGGPRLVFWEETSGWPRRPAWFAGVHATERLLYAARDVRFVAVSGFVRRRLVECERIPVCRVQLVYNGVNLARFAPGPVDDAVRREAGLDERPMRPEDPNPAARRVIISTVAYLRREKGVHDLVEAVARLAPRWDAITLLVAGDGPERGALEALARDRGVARNVRFLGLRSDVEQVLRASDIAVFPSRWEEAFGFVLAEAMGCAKPVVSTTVGAIPEIVVEGETGFLVPPGDPVALADRIGRLAEDAELRRRLGAAGRRVAIEKFDVERMVQETLDLYDELGGRAPV